jgi:hypothetical protein
MTNKQPDDKDTLLELLKKLWLPVAGFIGAVTLAYNFYKMWLGDRATVTYVTAGAGLIILFVLLGWIGVREKNITYRKKSKREPRYSPIHRRIAIGLLGLIIIGSSIGIWFLSKNWQFRVETLEKKDCCSCSKFRWP